MKRLITLVVLSFGCSASSEAPRVQLPVSASASSLSQATNDLGWLVSVTTARVALRDLVFTTEGQAHVATLWERSRDLMLPSAYAHDGHLSGGEVIGELSGPFIADFIAGSELGVATLIEGHYDGANFTFTQAPEIGGTLELAGTAVSGDTAVSWSAMVTQDADRAVVGLPLSLDLHSTDVSGLELQFFVVSAADDTDNVFNGIDFGTDPALTIVPESENGARLLEATQRHNFWQVAPLDRMAPAAR